jgi:hypothetical protein
MVENSFGESAGAAAARNINTTCIVGGVIKLKADKKKPPTRRGEINHQN